MLTLPAFVLFSAMALAGCQEEPTPNASPDQTSSNAEKNQSAETANAVWPYLDNTVETGVLDTDPLRDVYVVVLDMSGSMGDAECNGSYSNKAEAAKDALTKWSEALPADSKLGLVVFDGSGINTWVDPYPNNVRNFKEKIALARPDGGTPLASSVKQGYQELTRAGIEQQGYGTYRMVIVTDGAAGSGQDPVEWVNWLSENTPIEVHTIGFCINEGHSLNQPGITEYATAADPESLITGLTAVLAESTNFDVTNFKN
jgi:Mg-chelatase subunit ChlD